MSLSRVGRVRTPTLAVAVDRELAVRFVSRGYLEVVVPALQRTCSPIRHSTRAVLQLALKS
jgi:DNA topoisomerase IA